MSERAIFFRALDFDEPAARSAYLAEACASDAALRRRVEALLLAHCEAGDFLDRPAVVRPVPDGERPEDGVSLDFLAPPQKPGSLGRLGDYEVLEVVGKGGMGVVFRAEDGKLNRIVAIKALNPALACSGSARLRFVREAQAAASVVHDNLIDIHAVDHQGPVPYLVMQYVDGPTLQQKLERSGPLPVKEVLRIGLQIAEGLAAAHRQGLVHRDVKPANILLGTGTDRVKITDFGLARAVDDASLTQSGVIAGTPAFMSPEQANGEHVDHRSDLFSLGSVLYTLCAGHPPFRADTTLAVLKRVCEEKPRPLREINPDVPAWLAAVIAKLHAKSPADRYQTAEEVAEILAGRLARLQQPGGDKDESAGRAWGTRVVLPGVLAVILATAVLAGFVLNTRRPGSPADEPLQTSELLPAPDSSEQEQPPILPPPLGVMSRGRSGIPAGAPPELFALLPGHARFRLPRTGGEGHWPARSADGTRLAVPWGNEVLVFDAVSGMLLRTLTGHTGRAFRPAFSADGKYVASGSNDRTARVWDVGTGKLDLTLEGHDQPVLAAAFDPAGKRLVTGDSGGNSILWGLTGGGARPLQAKRLADLPGPPSCKGVSQIAFRPDGARMVTAYSWYKCRVWNAADGALVTDLSGNKRFEAVAWSRDGKLLAAGDDEKVILWDVDAAKDAYTVRHTLATPAKGLLSFSADGRTLLTARGFYHNSTFHQFSRWDVAAAKPLATFPVQMVGNHAFFEASPDGKTVYACEHHPRDCRVFVVDGETGKERTPTKFGDVAVTALAFDPDARVLASAGDDGTIRLWDLADWVPGKLPSAPRLLGGTMDAARSLAFSPDGSRLAGVGGRDGLLVLWDVATAKRAHELKGNARNFPKVAFHPDGDLLAVGGEEDGTVNLYDPRSGSRKRTLRVADGPVGALAFSRDGTLLAASDGASVRIAETKTGLSRQVFRGGAFTSVAFSPDGRHLAAARTGAGLGRIQRYEIATGKVMPAWVGLTDHTLGVAFDPNGDRLLAAAQDHTVRVYDNGPEPKELKAIDLKPFNFFVNCAAFTADGRYAAVGQAEGAIAFLRLP